MQENSVASSAFRTAQGVLTWPAARPECFIDLLPVATCVCDLRGRIVRCNQQAAALWGREPRLGDDAERFSGAHRLFRADGKALPFQDSPMAQTLRTGMPIRDAEVWIEQPDGRRICGLKSIDPIRNATGRMIGAINCFLDITARKWAGQALLRGDAMTMNRPVTGAQIGCWEERQRLLIHELNHRVRNMLATVQSMAALTLCDSDVAAYECFEARLSALSRAYALLAQCAWGAVALDELLMDVLAPYRESAPGRLSFAGERVVFDANAVLALSMAFHEIVCRAVSHGALSCADGRVAVGWQVLSTGADDDGGRLRLVWHEFGSALPALFAYQGFGPRLVERCITGQLRGSLVIEHTTDGIRYVIELPLADDVVGRQ